MTNRNKTLVILSPGFAKNEEDTTCLPSQQLLVRSLNKNFPSIEIVIFAFQYPYSRSTYEWHHNKVIAFNGKNRGKLSRLRIWLRVWRSLRELKKTRNIIGILTFWCTECALVGTWFSKFYGLTHRCWILGQDAKAENRFVQFIRPKPEELFAISPFTALTFMSNHGIQPPHIVLNGIEPTLFSQSTIARDIDIIGVGSLIPLKQYGLFVSIVKELTLRMPGIKALICGDGPEEQVLLSMISKLQVEKNITLAGEKPHTEVLQLMQRSKLLLHPSTYEGFSTACLEALYAGAHVISFCEPMSHKIKHWHVVKNNEEMLAEITNILSNPRIDHEPVVVRTMDDNAREVMKLFDH